MRPRLLAALVVVFAGPVGAQPPATTASGVYSEVQATRGRDIYLGSCKSCHTPESHTGAMFAAKWQGRPLSDLLTYIATEMPKNEPGSLSPQENADVLAYLLKLNRMPPGQAEIPTDSLALRSIRIEAPITVRKEP